MLVFASREGRNWAKQRNHGQSLLPVVVRRRAHYITMRLSVLLCAAGLTAVSAFAPISSQAAVSSSSTLRAVTSDDSTVGAFDPLNLASGNAEETNAKSSGGMGLAAATTAAWVASSDVASAAGPDWGIFEGVSFCCLPRRCDGFSFATCGPIAIMYITCLILNRHIYLQCQILSHNKFSLLYLSGPMAAWLLVCF